MRLIPIETSSAESGFTLMEVTMVCAILGVIALIGLPRLSAMTAAVRLDNAAAEIATTLRRACQTAALRGLNVGVKFSPNDGPSYTLYTDGDADGVRNADIRSGIDPRLEEKRVLRHLGGDVNFGIPLDRNGLPPRAPNSRSRLDRVDDPIRFNRSDIASFGRRGTATPGTVYLTDGQRAVAVRVLNRTGRVVVLHYDARREVWK